MNDIYIKKSDVGLTDFEIAMCDGDYKQALIMLLDKIENAPAADLIPVIYAKWEICCDGYYPYCSNCKEEPQGREMTKFCPNCGAIMNETNLYSTRSIRKRNILN